jgi:hypothetical protein
MWRTYLLMGLLVMPVYAISETKLSLLEWFVVNDSVMGGRSNSRLVVGADSLVFKGEVSLQNNGGFASVRAPFRFAESGVKQIRFVVKGDGKQYQLRLRVDQYIDGPAFVYKFHTQANTVQAFTVSAADFTLMYRGREVRSDYQLTFDDVRSLGFMISEKQAGEFSLAIHEVAPLQSI